MDVTSNPSKLFAYCLTANVAKQESRFPTVHGATGEPAVKTPLIGGSVPMYIFADLGLPVIGVPIANFDDNQHSPNENLRVGNLWKGMEIYGEILAGLEW